MTQVTGTVDKLYPSITRTGKAKADVYVNNEKYTLWGEPTFAVGSQVSFTAKHTGDYNGKPQYSIQGNVNVTGGATAQAQAPSQPRTQAPAKKAYQSTNSVGDFEKQRLIVAQNSMTNATTLVKARIEVGMLKSTKDEEFTKLVIETAGVLARAIMDGGMYEKPKFEGESSTEAPATANIQDDDLPF